MGWCLLFSHLISFSAFFSHHLHERLVIYVVFAGSQAEAVHAKDLQVQTLAGELKSIEAKLVNNQQIPEKPLPEPRQIVYRTDTVYIKQIEYITTVSSPATQTVNLPEDEVFEPARMESDVAQKRETDDIIFPSYQAQSKKQPTESMKFRIGSLVTKSN